MRQVSFSQGDTIIKKGMGGCSLYYLEQGHVNLMDLKKGQQKIEEKNFFGAKYFLGAIRNALNLGQVLSFRLLYHNRTVFLPSLPQPPNPHPHFWLSPTLPLPLSCALLSSTPSFSCYGVLHSEFVKNARKGSEFH